MHRSVARFGGMKRVGRLLALLLLAGTLYSATAQQIGFGYYDVDRLYDTLPSPFYNDTDYTPMGRYRWDTKCYRAKIDRIAAVIDSMRLPIIALYGVENEQVVRDLSATLQGDYLYLHRTLNTLDGMDFALLYAGDLLIPLRVETGRRLLYIEALLPRDTVGILLSHDPQSLPHILQELQAQRPTLPLLVAGNLPSAECATYGLQDRFERPSRMGFGNRRRQRGWRMADRIATSPALGTAEGQIFLRRFLLDEVGENPKATFVGQRYRGGAGRSLPIWIEIAR